MGGRRWEAQVHAKSFSTGNIIPGLVSMMKRGLVVLLILITVANAADSVATPNNQDYNEVNDNDFDDYFQDYFTYETMMDALNMLEAKHPDIMKVYDLTATIDENNRMGIPGSTWQGRKVLLVKISDGVDTEPEYQEPKFYSDRTEPDILIIGAHHGNEWPSFEVSMYFLFYLVENYGMPPTDNDGDGQVNEDPVDGMDNDGDGLIDEDENEARITWLVDNREIWIIPMFNPDGVTADTRVNGREEVPGGPGGSSVPTSGVDVNRNYPFMWNREPDPQTGPTMDSSNPMSGTYRGPDDNYDDDGDAYYEKEYIPSFGYKWTLRNVDEDPVDNIDNDNDGETDEDPDGGFSEPETVSMRNLVKGVDGNDDDKTDILTSISYHTYGGMILYPWGYSVDPTQHDDLLKYIATELSNFNGYDAMVGTELYPVSGELDDWLYGKNEVIPFTIELDSGSHKGEKEDIINISMTNLPCNLYLAEMAPVIEIAKGSYEKNLDVDLPVINHSQTTKMVNSDNTYTVKVEISNGGNLVKDSVSLYYRVSGSEDWKKLQMKEIDDEHYEATIPRQSGNRHVYYYIEAQANYIEAESLDGVVSICSPKYGQYDPYSYFVDISLGDLAGNIAAMILMMVLIFGIIYSGLVKSLKMALDAEKRKSMA